jgi:hypothetical protein
MEIVGVVEFEIEVEKRNRERTYREGDPVHQAYNQQSSHRTQILPQETLWIVIVENTKFRS